MNFWPFWKRSDMYIIEVVATPAKLSEKFWTFVGHPLEIERTPPASEAGVPPYGSERIKHDGTLSMRIEEPGSLDSLDSLGSLSGSEPPPWLLGFSKQFRKDTAGLDRKLLGRVFEVLTEISQSELPFEPRGDTLKPLTGALAGCWRYRLGDHRLVIRPQIKKGQIEALALGARGSVYD